MISSSLLIGLGFCLLILYLVYHNTVETPTFPSRLIDKIEEIGHEE